MSKVTEVLMYLVLPFALYEHMKNTPANIYGFPLMVIGFLVFLIPKITMIRKGKLISFGCEGMTNKMTFLYFAGIVLMFLGFIITFPIFSFSN
jgi:hypothetical protein